jgi:hypothetical protein
MTRRLLNLLTLLSLMLCVAACVLWVRSLRGPPWDEMYAVRATHSYGVGTEYGGVIAFLQRQRPQYHDNDSDDVQMYAGGFRYLRVTSAGMRRWNLALPAWFLAAAAALPLARAARHAATHHRRPVGHCLACGYDLRATPGRCPECGGAAIGAKADEAQR